MMLEITPSEQEATNPSSPSPKFSHFDTAAFDRFTDQGLSLAVGIHLRGVDQSKAEVQIQPKRRDRITSPGSIFGELPMYDTIIFGLPTRFGLRLDACGSHERELTIGRVRWLA
jgi:hypothetical protein